MFKLHHKLPIFLLCVIAAAAGACREDIQPSTTGGITAQVVWPGEGQSSGLSTVALTAPAPGTNWVVPSGVTIIRGTVTATDIASPPTTDITVNAGDTGTGSISGIPAGSNRTLTVEGLNSSGILLYSGSTTGVTVTAGQTTDAGTVVISLVAADLTTAISSVSGDGSTVTISYTISNIGNQEASGYDLFLWANRASAPSIGDVQDASNTPGTIVAGQTFSPTFSFSSSVTSGTAYVLVDPLNLLSEQDENNNLASFTW